MTYEEKEMKKIIWDRNEIDNMIFHVVQLLIYMLVCNLLLVSTLFVFGKTISWSTLIISVCIALGLLVFFYGEKIKGSIIIELICAFVLVVFLTCMVGQIYDFSWDGNSYHKLAVGLLKNHWNPMKELPTLELTEGSGNYSNGATLWCEAYCKVTWIFGACVYALTGNIECGKVYTILGMVCAFGLVFYYLRKKEVKLAHSLLLALCAGLNPVAVQQMLSFYIDGFLHTVLLMLVVALLMLEDKEKFDSKISASLIASLMIICGNIKFTGLLYGGIFCIVYYLWDCYKLMKTRKRWIPVAIKEGSLYLVLALTTMFWAGNSTYLTNYIRHNTFTYPLTGSEKVDIMSQNSPFFEENHFKNLFVSLFSKMGNSIQGNGKMEFKVPFSVDWKFESQVIGNVDNRISGFGILFGGIIIISLIVLVLNIVKNKSRMKLVVLNFITCLGMTIGIKESWWARYAPYVYFITLLAIFVTLVNKKKWINIIGCVLAALVIINNSIACGAIKGQFVKSQEVAQNIKQLKNYGPLKVYNKDFEGVYFNLKDKNVNYSLDASLVNKSNTNVMEYVGETLWENYQ